MLEDDTAAADATSLDANEGADEAELWRRWRGRQDPRARESLLERHMRHATVIAAMAYRQRVHDAVEFADYEQFARIGLLESFERYDPAQGAQFRTFAARRIRGAILDGLAQLTERQSQLSARRRLLADRLGSVVQQAAEDHGPAEGSHVEEAVPSALPAAQIFKVLADIGMGLAVGFMLEGTGMIEAGHEATGDIDPPYRALELRDTRARLLILVESLPAQERIVIRNHYLQGMQFDEIARALELTKGRISQIHKKALGRLRALLAERGACDRFI